MTKLFSFVALFLILGVVSNLTKVEKINSMEENALNVLGTPLQSCCTDPMTGFYRDGICNTGPTDSGRHVVCAEMTQEFLDYTKSMGNDLCTPFPQYNFPGLKPGDRWCLCAVRWKEAYDAGKAPPIILESTNAAALRFVDMDELRQKELKMN